MHIVSLELRFKSLISLNI